MRGSRAFTGLLPLAFYLNLHATFAGQYGVPVEIKVWDTGRTPLAHMVDVTNGFGLKVLAEHNFLNDNNIAFSPYGLMGILVALYEGVDGESSYQIQRAMQLPWNRNVMRIGFRDLHRTLKTYFVPEEGFLAGLALNNENVTFSDGYKKILRFYGFDLENDQLPTLLPSNSSNDSPVTTAAAPTDAETSTAAMTDASTATTKEETTTNPDAETVDVDIREPTEATTMSPSSAPNSQSTTPNIPPTDTTTVPPQTVPSTQATTPDLTTVATELTTTAATESMTTITAESTTTAPTESMTTIPTESTTILISTASSSNTPTTPVPETTIAIVIGSADTESVAQQTALATSALITEADNEVMASTVDMRTVTDATEMSTASTTETTGSTLSETTEGSTETTTAAVSESTLETLQRRKKSIVDFIFTSPPYVDDYFFYRSYNVGPEIPDQGLDHKLFLANGLKSVEVTYMRYDAVLEHAFLPHLEASALKLPLDSDRYYLLVVLPNRGGPHELGRLLGRMARESDLADIYSALRPRRVRATVPSFIVKGHVTLTTDLQKLGVRDVFEPRQRDFTLMTRQSGVYVRSIEQAVSVAIRKYRPDDQKKNRYVHNRDPVTFHATYPFLYFVMDSSIHVALMAGKMVDPLNSRIL